MLAVEAHARSTQADQDYVNLHATMQAQMDLEARQSLL